MNRTPFCTLLAALLLVGSIGCEARLSQDPNNGDDDDSAGEQPGGDDDDDSAGEQPSGDDDDDSAGGQPGGDDDDDSAGDDDDSAAGAENSVQICDPMPTTDPFTTDSALINGDNLEVIVSYGGGCQKHEFDLCWNGLVMQSLPPQITLSLIHQDNDDTCLAYLTDSLSFDLSSLQSAAPQGAIVIHFGNLDLSYSF